MVQLMLIATLGLIPQSTVLRQSVDLIEVNHFFDDQGRPVFSQVIFYDWQPATARYEVRAWRLLKSRHQVPRRDFLYGGYSCLWNDGGVYRWIFTPALRKTWTQYDPELLERERLPRERRRELPPPLPT